MQYLVSFDLNSVKANLKIKHKAPIGLIGPVDDMMCGCDPCDQTWTVQILRDCPQDVVVCNPHFVQHGGGTLAHYAVKEVCAGFSKHARQCVASPNSILKVL